MKKVILFLCFNTMCIFFVKAQWSVIGDDSTKQVRWNLVQKFTPEAWNASNFATKSEMEWFNAARYGMFIHFGLSTYVGKDLSWGVNQTRKAPDRGKGPIPDSVWTTYPQYFNFPNFDARKWVEIAKRAGMQYIVTIAKHHDGFHLWDTDFSDFKVTNTPFGRDYLKEIADACHEAGMKFGIYYSQRDWYHPDYAPVDPSLIEVVEEAPYFKPKPGVKKVLPGPRHKKYIEYQYNVVRELCTKYGKIDVFWFDASWWGGMFTADMWDSENLTRMIRELQPGIIINNRASIPGDFDTPEQKIGMYQERPWESCITLSGSWSWSNSPVKSKKTLIQMLTNTACGNGNMLLSWGPRWEGHFEPSQVNRLEEVGDWLKQYGHTIYNTKGGPWYPGSWGGSTSRGNKVFVHITSDTDSLLELPPLKNKIVALKSLTGEKVNFIQDNNKVRIDFNKKPLDQPSIIIELEFKDEILGMANNKSQNLGFADPIYGNIILKNEHLGSKGGQITVDLGQVYTVTGIDVANAKIGTSGIFAVEVSTDKISWKKIEEFKAELRRKDVIVAQFNAGIELPGVPARYMRLSLKGGKDKDYKLDHLYIYGKND
ncbi:MULTISPECIES: alpha-L-fucosidase [Sphingobacterium]|uniref:alpha-L-fucosidase n=1 Tax=Sphingobacterium TaxID=28453 RepID=UPI0013D98D42|nr:MULTISPECIES: alpha-L-fucosidase [unclassified Sphingobacterium]